LYSSQNSCHKAGVIDFLQRYFFSTVAQSLPDFLIAPFKESVFLQGYEVFNCTLEGVVLFFFFHLGGDTFPFIGSFIDFP